MADRIKDNEKYLVDPTTSATDGPLLPYVVPATTSGVAAPAGTVADPLYFMLVNGGSTQLLTFQGNSTDGVAQTGTSNALRAVVNAYEHNGTSWDRKRKPNLVKRVASSAASGNPDFLKASAGDLTMFWGVAGANPVFLQVYNLTTAPTIGSSTPIITYPIAANEKFAVTIDNGGLYFNTGIAFAFTTDAAGTTGSAAAAVTSFALIGA